MSAQEISADCMGSMPGRILGAVSGYMLGGHTGERVDGRAEVHDQTPRVLAISVGGLVCAKIGLLFSHVETLIQSIGVLPVLTDVFVTAFSSLIPSQTVKPTWCHTLPGN